MNLQAGQNGSYTIDRPQGVAGIEADIQWAIHLRQQQQAQDAKANEAAYNLGRALGGGGSSSGSSNSNNESGTQMYDINGRLIMCNKTGIMTSCY
jgi:hypothetical protein